MMDKEEEMIKTCQASTTGVVGQLAFLIVLLFLCCISLNPALAEKPRQPVDPFSAFIVPNPGSDLWKEIRERTGPLEGMTQVQGTDTGTLINIQGQAWREFRTEQIIPYSGYLLAGILIVIVAFRLIRGQVKIKTGRSSRRILRFTYAQRVVHWFAGITFVILGITGVILMLGRTVLIPVMGNSAFSVIATASKIIHDYLGPLFAISLVFLFIYYVKDNLYKLRDIQWFLKGGGMLGVHAHAGRFNAGEKTWFWLAILLGIVVVASGLVLDFPIFGLDRETMELSLVVHGIAAVVVFGISFGHMYLATFGMEGALETMVSGYCDENWAKEHHDDWYEEVKDTAEPIPSEDSGSQGTTGQATPSGA